MHTTAITLAKCTAWALAGAACFTVAACDATLTLPDFTEDSKHSYQPERGMVPDEATAIAIALAVWRPIYGEQNIARQAPFHARLTNGEWTVEGYLPPNMLGGVALAVISQRDGRILRISHGK